MKRSRILFAGVLAAVSLFPFSHAFSAEVWAPGVSLSGGWYDFNKYSKGGTPSSNDSRMTDDGNMCWAASAANVIAWWQEQNNVTSEYPDKGTIPQKKDVYQTFVGVFENVGGNPAPAFQWWVGVDVDGDGDSDSDVVPGTRTVFGDEGGPAWTGIDGKTYYPDFYYSGGLLTNSYYTSTPFYSFSGNPVTIANSSSSNLTVQNKAIVDALSSGYALSLEVSTNDDNSPEHAITLWGVEYTEAANGDITLTKAYITDSDDKHEGLVGAEVNGKGHLHGMMIANLAYEITSAHGLRTIAIPEPSAFGLLAGLGAFALAV